MTGEPIAVWPTVPLGSLLTDIQPGFASGKHNSAGDGIPHFRPMNVSTDGRIEREVLKYVEPSIGRPDLRLRHGDVVFNNTNSPELVGKTALFVDTDAPAFSNHMTRLRTDPERLHPGFLALRLHQAWREGWFAAHCNNHVSQASIGRDVLKAFKIELPPITVQKGIIRIYYGFDASRTSAGSRLTIAYRAVERFRQAILAAACSGRLTADWREKNDHETTIQLLKDIRDARGSALGSKTKKAAGPANYNFEVPGSWSVTSLDRLSTRITSGSRDWSRFYGHGSGTFVMAQNVRRGYLDWSFRQSVDPPQNDASRERSQISIGDLLVTIVGANTGDVGPVTDDRPEHYVCQSVALVRPALAELAHFLNLWFNSPEHGRGYFAEYIYGAGRPHLSFDQLKSAPVAVPPLAEQEEIMHRVEALMKLADDLLGRIKLVSRAIDLSSQAFLAKAFRGELTPRAEVDTNA